MAIAPKSLQEVKSARIGWRLPSSAEEETNNHRQQCPEEVVEIGRSSTVGGNKEDESSDPDQYAEGADSNNEFVEHIWRKKPLPT